MEISIKDAARLMGKSVRQVRYLIGNGKLSAKKKNGIWFIEKDSLILSESQQRAIHWKEERAVQLAEKVFFEKGDRKAYSVLDLKVFRTGVQLFQDIMTPQGIDLGRKSMKRMQKKLKTLRRGHPEELEKMLIAWRGAVLV